MWSDAHTQHWGSTKNIEMSEHTHNILQLNSKVQFFFSLLFQHKNTQSLKSKEWNWMHHWWNTKPSASNFHKCNSKRFGGKGNFWLVQSWDTKALKEKIFNLFQLFEEGKVTKVASKLSLCSWKLPEISRLGYMCQSRVFHTDFTLTYFFSFWHSSFWECWDMNLVSSVQK